MDDLQATLLELARTIQDEQNWRDDTRSVWSEDLQSKELSESARSRVRGLIVYGSKLRSQRADEIRQVAGDAPQAVAAILFDAATKLDTGDREVPRILATAAAALQAKPVQSALPVVRLQPPEVEYNGKVFQVEPDIAVAFQAMIEKHPDRVGLTKTIGAHPERKMAKLPTELKTIVDTSGKGSRLVLS